MREQLVYRRWQRARSRYFQRYLCRQDADSVADHATIYPLVTLLLALPLDLTLLGFDWDLWGLRRLSAIPGPAVALALGAVFAVNAIRVDRQLGRWGAADRAPRPSARFARALLFGVPFLSAFSLAGPLWGRAEKRWPDLLLQPLRSGARLPLDPKRRGPPRAPAWRAVEALHWGQVVAACFVAEIAVVLGGVAWLAGEREPSRGRWIAVALASAVVHAVAAGVFWIGNRERILQRRLAGWRRRSRAWLPILCLAPSPIALAPPILDLAGSVSSGSFVWSGFVSHEQPDRTPVWRGLRRRLRSRRQEAGWWSRWREPSGGSRNPERPVVERRLRELIQAKGLLTVADGLILGWVSVAVTGGLGANVAGHLEWRDPLLMFPLAIAAAGVALAGVGYAGILLRVPRCDWLVRDPYGGCFAWLGWGLVLGVLVGKSLAGGAIGPALALLAIGSVLPVSLSAVGLMLRPVVSGDPPRLVDAIWALSPTAWGLLAWAYSRPRLRDLAVAFVVLAPLWHAILGFTLGRWLLWPFHLRDLDDRDLPSSRRRLLALLAATAVLPGGGLAAPFWIFVRRRLGPDLGRRALAVSEA